MLGGDHPDPLMRRLNRAIASSCYKCGRPDIFSWQSTQLGLENLSLKREITKYAIQTRKYCVDRAPRMKKQGKYIKHQQKLTKTKDIIRENKFNPNNPNDQDERGLLGCFILVFVGFAIEIGNFLLALLGGHPEHEVPHEALRLLINTLIDQSANASTLQYYTFIYFPLVLYVVVVFQSFSYLFLLKRGFPISLFWGHPEHEVPHM